MFNAVPWYWLLGCLLCQVCLISGWVSRCWVASRLALITHYPPETFPGLYGFSKDVEIQHLNARFWLDNVILGLGIMIVALIVAFQSPKQVIATVMLAFAVVQWIPILLSYRWCQKSRHLRAQHHPRRVRRTTITTFSLLEFASLPKWGMTFVTFIGANGMAVGIFYLNNQGFSADKLMLLIGMSTLMMAYLLVQMWRKLKLPRTDHFMENDEWVESQIHHVSSTLTSLILYHLFFIGLLFIKVCKFDPLLVNVLASLLVQYFAWTVRYQYLPVTPSVYKNK